MKDSRDDGRVKISKVKLLKRELFNFSVFSFQIHDIFIVFKTKNLQSNINKERDCYVNLSGKTTRSNTLLKVSCMDRIVCSLA